MEFVSKISRRNIILSGGAALLCRAADAALPVGTVSHTNGRQSPLASRRMLLIKSPSDGTFESDLQALFPGLNQDSTFQMIAPLAVLITNANGPGIRALGLRWLATIPTGSYQKTLFFYFSSDSDTLISGQKQFLRRGETRLVSPFFSWAPKRFQTQGIPDWNEIFERAGSLRLLAQQPQGTTSARVQLDAAIYADWVVTGRDDANLARHLSVRRNAEYDEALRALELVKSDGSDADIIAGLRQHKTIQGVAGVRVPRSKPNRFWYFKTRTLQAKVLLRRFKKGNRDQLVSDLMSLGNQPRMKIHMVRG